jgi:hypothetical protein
VGEVDPARQVAVWYPVQYENASKQQFWVSAQLCFVVSGCTVQFTMHFDHRSTHCVAENVPRTEITTDTVQTREPFTFTWTYVNNRRTVVDERADAEHCGLLESRDGNRGAEEVVFVSLSEESKP